MGRRGHGEGTIYRRADGRWVGAITGDAGRRRYVYGKTRQEVQTKLASARREAEQGVTAGDARQTVAAYFAWWLETRKPLVRRNTYATWESALRLYIIPGLGHVKLAKLSAQQVQGFISDLLDGKIRSAIGRTLSRQSIRGIHSVLRIGLNQAVRLGLVARNVASLVQAPRGGNPEMRMWTREEARRFLSYVQSQRSEWYAFYALALSTGMRQGELLGLTWSRVNLAPVPAVGVDSGPGLGPAAGRGTTLRVERSLDRTGQLADPKTVHSKRLLFLDAEVVQALREHRRRQSESRLRVGPAWVDHDFVFCDALGGPATRTLLCTRGFHRLQRAAGVPEIRFHDLRHTCATLLLQQGLSDKEVSALLGHASVVITLDRYTHLPPDTEQRAANAIAAALFH